MLRLLIADDHAIVRDGLKQIFSMTPDFVVAGEAVNGTDVLERLRQQAFDLLLLDINMPGVSGVDLIARVRAHQPTLPILMLSMHDEVAVASRMLRAGANGYITKDSESDVLQAAIRRVAGGGKYIAPELAEKMVFEVATPGTSAPHLQLSDRELEVMGMLVTGKSVNDIAEELFISNKTVSTHKARLMEKLNLTNMADLMRYAMENKLLS